jgi:ATP-binding protein involved in chromosome partitioning
MLLIMTDITPEITGLPPRVTGRTKHGRTTLLVDVTDLDPGQADALEADALAAAAAQGLTDARVLRTSERHARRLIAVASGKGGVGKSTVSTNLAVGLARLGRKVGLVDADIYGPSQPRLLAAGTDRPDARDNKMIPVMTPYGVSMLSMGMLVDPGQAIAWRGPMAGNALGQLIDAHWGATDPLIIDMPPGTGDVQLTMVQKHKPVGAVIVSTPQDLALIDAARAIDLFVKAGVPIIGFVENMAGYACPSCGEVSDPFGHGGAEAEAARLGIDFLGRIPLSIAIRRDSDAGQPPVAGNGPDAAAFEAVAGRVDAWLRDHGG